MKLWTRILSVSLALLFCFALTACGGGDSSGKTTLRVYNWGDYIDPDVLSEFEEQNPDIRVVYDTFDSNEGMLAKLDGGARYDVLFPSEYMVEKMIQEDWLMELDLSKIPNVEYIDQRFLNLAFDPENKYSVPYTWGTLGILYNTTMVTEPVDSWGILFSEEYAGKIIMYDSVRDSMAVALKYLGYSVNEHDEARLKEAGDLLAKQKQNGLVKAYMTDTVKEAMIGGNAALAVVYSGDAVLCMDETDGNADLAYAVPKEGSNLFFDNIVISKDCESLDAAYRFINYLCDPAVAARNIAYIGYSTPSSAAAQIMGEAYLNDPVFMPDEETLARCEVFLDLGSLTGVYNRIWESVKLQ
ncbi:MAG: ABC transporter substrate-binding protein [Clostridia bacterium]|nr:ABC transporter substrate-binding protein [Clostridia bacterium]